MSVKNETTSSKKNLRTRLRGWLNDTENRSLIVPYLIFAVFALICYVFFCYHDILITAHHSYGYLDGRFLDYYTASHEMDGTYGSNYFPLTFIFFAIWNLPLKLFGFAPSFFGDWGVVFALWNKLLPVLFLFASACVMYRLAFDRLHFGRGKAIIAATMLLMSPYAFFSQFLFAQYDSFVIFFMLLGMYYFFNEDMRKKDWILFSIFFGVATAFKYFAAVVYVIFLVLKQKNILKILTNAIVFILPLAVQFGFYFLFDRSAFIQSVLKFGVIDYVSVFGIRTLLGMINLVYLFLIAIIAFAYFTNPSDHYSLLGWSCFYACGASFVLFGLMSWHPQWLLFAVPFWTLSTMINRKWDIFLLLDCAAAVIFNIFVSKAFYHQADETLFRYGILSDKLQFNEPSSFSVSNVFGFLGIDLIYTLLVAIFLVSFIFKHPRFNMEKPDEPMPYATRWLTTRFLCGVISFLIPAFICLPAFMSSDTYLWANFSDEEHEDCIELTEDEMDICQYFSLEGKEIHSVSIHTRYLEQTIPEYAFVMLSLLDDNGELLAMDVAYSDEIANNGMTKFNFSEKIPFNSDSIYTIRISTYASDSIGVVIGEQPMPTHKYYNVFNKDYSDSQLIYRGDKVEDANIVMNIYGDH